MTYSYLANIIKRTARVLPNNLEEYREMKKRNVGLAVLFSIITFGIYGIYWFVCLTNDSNTINPEEKTASGGLAIVLSLVTFGIYGIYWNYKLGKKLTGSGTLYLILSLIGLGIVNYILGQSEINKYIEKSATDEQIAA